MNTDVIKSIIAEYKKSFQQIDNDERYKWEAIKCFQDNWNPDAENFEEMLKASTAKAKNLLDSQSVFPRGMILEYARKFPEETRQWFIALFDEAPPLLERIQKFIETAQKLNDKFFQGQAEKKAHYQDLHAISVYLSFRYPEKYFFYKRRMFASVAEQIGFEDIPQQGKIENLPAYFKMADEIRQIIVQDDELKQLNQSRLDDSCYKDQNCTVLTQDIILFAQKRYTPQFRIWKMSLGEKFFSEEQLQKFLDKDKVSMGPDTPPVAGKEDQLGPFLAEDRMWDIVFICHGNNEISRLALFSPGKAFEDTEDLIYDPFQGENVVWTARHTITVADAKKNTGFLESENKKRWYPNIQSTFIEVKERDWNLFEEKILQPFFDMSLDDLSEQRSAIIKNYTGEVSMLHTTLQQEIRSIVEEKKQIILTGAPGTGKTYIAQEVAAEMILGKTISSADRIEDELKAVGKLGQYQFVQFHPGYDYSDFVEGIKPRVDKNSSNPEFSLEDGIFKKFCMAASAAFNNATDKTDAPKFVMVIDEINRADLSRVFGELFFGLEKDYRGKEIRTQYDYLKRIPGRDEFKDGFSRFEIPPNLYIIGTMNDIDRSVENMDFALRRRFGWCEISWEDSLAIIDIKIPEASNPLVNRAAKEIMTSVNNVIIKDKMELEPAFALGGAYFKDAAEKSWDDLWRHSIRIILNEYLRGNRCDKSIDDIEKIWQQEVNKAMPGTYESSIPGENQGNAE